MQILKPLNVKVEDVINPTVFGMAARKIDKLSGDIRVCFNILQQALTIKLESLKGKDIKVNESKEAKVSCDDINAVINDMFGSKVMKLIKKMPRSHIILLDVIADIVEDSNKGQLTEMNSTELLKKYN